MAAIKGGRSTVSQAWEDPCVCLMLWLHVLRACVHLCAPVCCVQAGVLGGLQLWDERSGPSPVSKSSSSWGHTGSGQLDKQLGALRQVCIYAHAVWSAAAFNVLPAVMPVSVYTCHSARPRLALFSSLTLHRWTRPVPPEHVTCMTLPWAFCLSSAPPPPLRVHSCCA
jgi:hypothetical protein